MVLTTVQADLLLAFAAVGALSLMCSLLVVVVVLISSARQQPLQPPVQADETARPGLRRVQ